MTDLLERRALPDRRPFTDLPCSPHTHTHTHTHTMRCWWDVGLGGWVCPPGDGRT